MHECLKSLRNGQLVNVNANFSYKTFTLLEQQANNFKNKHVSLWGLAKTQQYYNIYTSNVCCFLFEKYRLVGQGNY